MGKRKSSKNSMLGMMQRMIYGSNTRSSSRIEINRIQSAANITSRNSNARRRQRNLKSSKAGLERSTSKPSRLLLSRIEYNLDDFIEISESSNKPSPHSNPESRHVSESLAF